MKNKEIFQMCKDSEKILASTLLQRIRKILYDTFGHEDADVEFIPRTAPALITFTDMAPCPFGVLLTSIRWHYDQLAVRFRWTVDGTPVGDEVEADMLGEHLHVAPVPVLQEVLRAASLAFSLKTWRSLREAIQGGAAATPKEAETLIKECGCGIVNDRLDPAECAFGSSDIERAACESDTFVSQRLPPYCVIAREGVQAVACLEDGRLGLLPYLWSNDTGLVEAA